MGRPVQIVVWVSAALACACLAGCGENGRSESVAASSNRSARAASATVVRPLTESQQRAMRIRTLIDADKSEEALELAIKLHTDSDYEVRLAVVSALGWIGREGMPLLEIMIGDPDSRIADLAMHEWGTILKELPSDRQRVDVAIRAAGTVRNGNRIRRIFMGLSGVSPEVALPRLEGVITNHPSGAVSLCAKETFEFLAREKWSSPERTLELLKNIKNDNKGEKWRK